MVHDFYAGSDQLFEHSKFALPPAVKRSPQPPAFSVQSSQPTQPSQPSQSSQSSQSSPPSQPSQPSPAIRSILVLSVLPVTADATRLLAAIEPEPGFDLRFGIAVVGSTGKKSICQTCQTLLKALFEPASSDGLCHAS